MKKTKSKLRISIIIGVIALVVINTAQAQELIEFNKAVNFGGYYPESFYSVTTVSDGFVATGAADFYSTGTGDWEGITGRGSTDAIVIKYDNDLNVVWKQILGGAAADYHSDIITVSDGIVAVGRSAAASFGNGDWVGITARGNDDATVAKYDFNGNVIWIWKKNFGGSGNDMYVAVTEVPDGIVAVGTSAESSFGTGDWSDVAGKGSQDAIIVKYDINGNVVWKKNFGGYGYEWFSDVITVSDGVVVAGYADIYSFGTGDWTAIPGKGEVDAIIVKFNFDGNIVWKKNFGGNDEDSFNRLIAVDDGIIAVGSSSENSFGNGDWSGITGKGKSDAIMVKYNHDGNVIWKKNFGGADSDSYQSITTVSDGVIVVGNSKNNSFGNGDWIGHTAQGEYDATFVKHDNDGNIVWKHSHGGISQDAFYGVTVAAGDFIAVGNSNVGSFGTGDWIDIPAKGGMLDATVVKYVTHKPVTGIIDLPTTATINVPLPLTATIVPSNATNQNITWSIVNAGTTNAVINGNEFLASSEGIAYLMARIENGILTGMDYTHNFTITVSKPSSISEITASEIIIYPNPACGKLRMENGELRISGVEIYGINGRMVKCIDNPSEEIDVSDLQQGMYFIKIKTEKGEVVRKLKIER